MVKVNKLTEEDKVFYNYYSKCISVKIRSKLESFVLTN